MIINGRTKTVALIGDPVEHSFSPFIHNYGFNINDLNMVYVNHNVAPYNLEDAIKGIKALGYVGANITYPYKIEVIKYLDEISEEARLIGAVNTIKNVSGRLIGYNTDGMGFIYGLAQDGIDIEGKTICILGAGGAARSIAISLCLEAKCNIIICSRTLEKAMVIYNSILSSDIAFKGVIERPILPEKLNLDYIDIIINCTPVGMYESEDRIPFDIDRKDVSNKVICDLIYQPEETSLLREARLRGSLTHNGLNMLVGQGIIAFKIWTGIELNFNNTKMKIYDRIQKKL